METQRPDRVNSALVTPSEQLRALRTLAGVIARGNVYAHDHGYVDRKYLREVSDSQILLGAHHQYLKDIPDLIVGVGSM